MQTHETGHRGAAGAAGRERDPVRGTFHDNALSVCVAAGVLYPFAGLLLSPILASAADARELGLRRSERPAASAG
jgi:hypothetical protein